MNNRPPCKFFAEGRCRFGNDCRFSHQSQGGGGFTGTSDYFGSKGGSVDAKQYAAIEESMQKDMHEWIQGKIWTFSSYGPVGSRGSIPGFEDLSPEEIRYETLLNGGLTPAYVTQKLAQLDRARQTIMQDRTFTRSLIDQAFRSEIQQQSQVQQQPAPTSSLFSLLGGKQSSPPPTSSIFGGTSQIQPTLASGGIFGQAPVNVNPFQPQSAQPSIFGGSSIPNTGAFLSNNTSPQATSNLFATGPAQPTSIFGQNLSSGSAGSNLNQSFGQAQNLSTFPPSPFSTKTTQQQGVPTTTIFGGSSVIGGGGSFGATQQSGLPSPPGSLFGSALSPIAPQQTQQPSIFGGPATSSFLHTTGQTLTSPMSTPPFGLSSADSTAMSQPFGVGISAFGSPFKSNLGVAPPNFTNPPISNSKVPPPSARDPFVYSAISDLTPEEMSAFEAESFGSCENIPLKPPPKELCFR